MPLKPSHICGSGFESLRGHQSTGEGFLHLQQRVIPSGFQIAHNLSAGTCIVKLKAHTKSAIRHDRIRARRLGQRVART